LLPENVLFLMVAPLDWIFAPSPPVFPVAETPLSSGAPFSGWVISLCVIRRVLRCARPCEVLPFFHRRLPITDEATYVDDDDCGGPRRAVGRSRISKERSSREQKPNLNE
jgi:hypothetical protein